MSFFRNVNQIDNNQQTGNKRKDRDFNLNPYNLHPKAKVSQIDGRELTQYEIDGNKNGLCNIPETTQEEWEGKWIWVYEPTPYDVEISYVPLDVMHQFQDLDSPLYHQGRRIIRKHEFVEQLKKLIDTNSARMNSQPVQPTNNTNNINNTTIRAKSNRNNPKIPRTKHRNPIVPPNEQATHLEYRQNNPGFNRLIQNLLHLDSYFMPAMMFDGNGNIIKANNETINLLKDMRRYCTSHNTGKLTGREDNDPEWKLFKGDSTETNFQISDYDLFVNLLVVVSTNIFSLLRKFCKNSNRIKDLLNNLNTGDILKLIEKSRKPIMKERKSSNEGLGILLSHIDNLDKLKSLLLVLPDDAKTILNIRIADVEKKSGLIPVTYVDASQISREDLQYQTAPGFQSEPPNLYAADSNPENILHDPNGVAHANDPFEQNYDENFSLTQLLREAKATAIEVETAKILIVPTQCEPSDLISATIGSADLLNFKVESQFDGSILQYYVFNCDKNTFNAVFPDIYVKQFVTNFESCPVFFEQNQNYIRIYWTGNLQEKIVNTLHRAFSVSPMLGEFCKIYAEPNQSHVDLVINANIPIKDVRKFILDMLSIPQYEMYSTPMPQEINLTEDNIPPANEALRDNNAEIPNISNDTSHSFNLVYLSKLYKRHANTLACILGTDDYKSLIDLLCSSLKFNFIPMMFDENQKVFEASIENIEILHRLRSYSTKANCSNLTGLNNLNPEWKLFTGQVVANRLKISDYDLFLNFYRVLCTYEISLINKFIQSSARLPNLLNNLTPNQLIKIIEISILPYKTHREATNKRVCALLSCIDDLDLLRLILNKVPPLANESLEGRILILEQRLNGESVSYNIQSRNSTRKRTRVKHSVEPIAPAPTGHSTNDATNANIEPNLDLEQLLKTGKAIALQVDSTKLLIMPLYCHPQELSLAISKKASVLTFEVDPQFSNNDFTVFNCDINAFRQNFSDVSIRKYFMDFENNPLYYEVYQDQVRISWFGDLQQQIVNTLSLNLAQNSGHNYSILDANQNFVDLLVPNSLGSVPVSDIENLLTALLSVNEPAPTVRPDTSYLQENTMWRNSSPTSINSVTPREPFQP